MLDSLKEFKNDNYDSFIFLPTDNDGQIRFQGSMYKEPGLKIDGSEIGDCYHIILFKEDDDGEITQLDMFEAILMAPLEYMSRLLPDEWFGIICRKTTTSKSYAQEIFDNLNEIC